MGNLVRIFLLLTGAATAAALVTSRAAGPSELSAVRWLRDLDAARATAARTGKPLMVMFGGGPSRLAAPRTGPLSHPIVVDAANHEFVAVRAPADLTTGRNHETSAGRHDAISFLAADGRDLTAREVPADTTPSAAGLLREMERALLAAGRPVPEYLRLVAGEYDPPALETATFAVTCYWKGEKELGALDDIVATRTGMLDGEEVVEVDFNPDALEYHALATSARSMACFRKVYARTPAQAAAAVDAAEGPSGVATSAEPVDTSGNEQQYHLWLRKAWHLVPLTRLQATKVNAALLRHESPDRFLSPGQLAIQRRLQRIYDRDHRALDAIEATVKVDRSPAGLVAYADAIGRKVGGR